MPTLTAKKLTTALLASASAVALLSGCTGVGASSNSAQPSEDSKSSTPSVETTDDADTTAAPLTGEPTSAADDSVQGIENLGVGDCYTMKGSSASTVSCTSPHSGEVFYVFDAPAGAYPAADAETYFEGLATQQCVAPFTSYTGSDYQTLSAAEGIDISWYYPLEGSWKMNDRSVQCVIVEQNDGQLTKPYRK